MGKKLFGACFALFILLIIFFVLIQPKHKFIDKAEAQTCPAKDTNCSIGCNGDAIRQECADGNCGTYVISEAKCPNGCFASECKAPPPTPPADSCGDQICSPQESLGNSCPKDCPTQCNRNYACPLWGFWPCDPPPGYSCGPNQTCGDTTEQCVDGNIPTQPPPYPTTVPSCDSAGNGVAQINYTSPSDNNCTYQPGTHSGATTVCNDGTSIALSPPKPPPCPSDQACPMYYPNPCSNYAYWKEQAITQCANHSSCVIPSPSIPPDCSMKSKGDANCDGKIDMKDFYLWKNEFLINSNPFVGAYPMLKTDFNGSGKVDTDDFNIWRDSYLSTGAPPPPTSCPTPITCPDGQSQIQSDPIPSESGSIVCPVYNCLPTALPATQ